jgi:uncharacterized protein with von Willebrand factor type A (vWA) domain
LPLVAEERAGGQAVEMAETATGRVDVDGGRLLRQTVVFARSLRTAGLSVDLGAVIDFTRALTLVDMGDREQVRWAGAAIFVRRRDEREPYDAAFDRFWRRRGIELPRSDGPLSAPAPELGDPDEANEGEGSVDGPSEQALVQTTGLPVPTGDDDEDDGEPVEGFIIAPDAYSATEVLRHREFDRMTSAELRYAERLIDLLTPRLERRRTRRQELHHRGRRVAPRAMFRRNLATGGEALDWVWSRPVRRPRQIVVLCDISGSMERQSRLLLRFIQALAASNQVRTESFVFGTRLTRVTRLLRTRDRDAALRRVSETVTDWAGGTRIGDSFREFNLRWARRVLRTSGIVIVVSDGWDRGDPMLVAAETARLQRNCHRLIWLNPLAGAEGYEPLAAGMKAAYPFIDDFVAAGTLGSLERLGELLAERSSPHARLLGRPRRVGVATHRRTGGDRAPGASRRAGAPGPNGAERPSAGAPRHLEHAAATPTAARPLG